MLNHRVEHLKPEILGKLESRLEAAKKRLDAVRLEKPNDRAALWIVERKVYDIEREIQAWAKLK